MTFIPVSAFLSYYHVSSQYFALRFGGAFFWYLKRVVELRGFEPLTPCLQSPVEPSPHYNPSGVPRRPGAVV